MDRVRLAAVPERQDRRDGDREQRRRHGVAGTGDAMNAIGRHRAETATIITGNQ
jgi:hypothetical protein